MKGFGISVSRAVDINDDFYPGKLFASCLCEIKTDNLENFVFIKDIFSSVNFNNVKKDPQKTRY